ncbi:MAG: Crp/Fnr family transcriptional regulator [Motiliproteus sp.]|nr:Crp/Fnr family transcriptional regulator [Motiliproteus sp.]MCW9054224.1 Crp/Fnr family transcriptional regulator [Motiliproteus sp.]
MDPLLLQHFPELAKINDSAGQQLLAKAQLVELPAEQVVFSPGDSCENYLLVVEGAVKVLARGQNGREIVLYRIENTGSCVLTTSCLLGQDHYPAEGITETPVKAFVLPRQLFQQALQESPGLRNFIFQAYGERLSDLIHLVQEVAFERIDLRLARHLLQLGRSQIEIHCTHQQLATELGSAREVVSRQLKEFEKRGWIELGRGTIRIDDLNQLQQFLQQADQRH